MMKMKKHALILPAVALLLANVSCHQVYTDRLDSLQPKINSRMIRMSSDDVLTFLGQPNETRYDTISGLPVTELDFTDSVTLMNYKKYSAEDLTEPAFIKVYLKNDEVYSVKTNLVRKSSVPAGRQLSPVAALAFFMFLLSAACVIVMLQLCHINRRTGSMLSYVRHIKTDILDCFPSDICDVKSLLRQQNSTANYLKSIQSELRSFENIRTDITTLNSSMASLANSTSADIQKLQSAVERKLDDIKFTLSGFPSQHNTVLQKLQSAVERKLDDIDSTLSDFPNPPVAVLSSADVDPVSEEHSDELQHFLDMEVSASPLPPRVKAVLALYTNIATIGQLCTLAPTELRHLKNFGRRSLADVRKLLSGHGVSLGSDLPAYGYPRKKPTIEDNIKFKRIIV